MNISTFFEYVNDKPWFNVQAIKNIIYYIEHNDANSSEIDCYVEKYEKKLKKQFIKKMNVVTNKRLDYKLNDNIFPIGKEVEISISCKYKYQNLCGKYSIILFPLLDYPITSENSSYTLNQNVTAENNTINFKYTFTSEQQYELVVTGYIDDVAYPLIHESIYALNQDLFEQYYLKGDFHVHTTFSDGYDSPEMTIVSAKSSGMDFIAITDHNYYDGSVYTENIAKEMNSDLIILRGEECSPSFSPIHILCIGAPEKINPNMYSKIDMNNPLVKQYLNVSSIQSDVDLYAGTQALFDEIHRIGGVSFICHPFWKPIGRSGLRKDVPLSLLYDLFSNKRFNGIEIVSGTKQDELDNSNIQDILARELNIKYDSMPVISVTDSHCYSNNEIAGLHYTIVFCNNKTSEGIINALKNGRVVAIKQMSRNEKPICYGSFRYVMFARFLIANYFPQHDIDSFIDGELLRKKLENNYN